MWTTEAEAYDGVYQQYSISGLLIQLYAINSDLYVVSLAISGVQHKLVKKKYDEEC